MDYTITLTEAENKAMEYIATDVNDWITNSVINRARIAIDEIVALEVERITSQGGELSGTKEDIVLAAPIKSARERQEEFDSQDPLTTTPLMPYNT
jgi:hypothetical protein